MTPMRRLVAAAATAAVVVTGLPLAAHAVAPGGATLAAHGVRAATLGDVLNLETYAALRSGMTIDEVAAVMQVPPTSTSTMDLLGSELTTHMWVGLGGGITVMFTDGAVTSITQVGLRSAEPAAQPEAPATVAQDEEPVAAPEEGAVAAVPVAGNPAPARADAAGTRRDPLPLGTPVRTGDFAVTVHSVRALASDERGDVPGREDSVFVVADVTVTNHGRATTLEDALPGLIAVRSGFSTASPRQHLSERGCAAGDRLTFGTAIAAGATLHGTTCWEAAAESWDEGVLRVPHEGRASGEPVFVALAGAGAGAGAVDAAGAGEGFTVPGWAWPAGGAFAVGVFSALAASKRGAKVDKSLFDGSDDARRLRAGLEQLARLAPLYGTHVAGGDPQPIAEKIGRLVDEIQELHRRLALRGTPQQLALAQSEYAGTVEKVALFVDPEYLKNILDTPHRWHHPDKRVADVVAALDAVHDQVVENIRQANSKADLNFQVALASLAAVAQEDEFKHLYQGAS